MLRGGVATMPRPPNALRAYRSPKHASAGGVLHRRNVATSGPSRRRREGPALTARHRAGWLPVSHGIRGSSALVVLRLLLHRACSPPPLAPRLDPSSPFGSGIHS